MRSSSDVHVDQWLRTARLQNEIAPEKFLNRHETWFEKREKGSEKRSETCPKKFKPLSRRLKISHRPFCKSFSPPNFWKKSRGALMGTELRWQSAPKTQIFAENRRFSQIHPFFWECQHVEGAGNRWKPQIFAGSRRKPQIGLRHLRSVTFSSALKKLFFFTARLCRGSHANNVIMRARKRSGEGVVRRNGCPKGCFWRVRFCSALLRFPLKTSERSWKPCGSREETDSPKTPFWTTVSPHDPFAAPLARPQIVSHISLKVLVRTGIGP